MRKICRDELLVDPFYKHRPLFFITKTTANSLLYHSISPLTMANKENPAPAMVWGSPIEPPSKRRPKITSPSSCTADGSKIPLFPPPPLLRRLPVVSTETSTSTSTLPAAPSAPAAPVAVKKRGRIHGPSVLMTLPVPQSTQPNLPHQPHPDHHCQSNLTVKSDLMTAPIPSIMANLTSLPSPIVLPHPTVRTATNLSVKPSDYGSQSIRLQDKHSIEAIDIASLTLSDMIHVVGTRDDGHDAVTANALVVTHFDDADADAADTDAADTDAADTDATAAAADTDTDATTANAVVAGTTAAVEGEEEEEEEEEEEAHPNLSSPSSSSSSSSSSSPVYWQETSASQTNQSNLSDPSPVSQSHRSGPSQIPQSNLVILDACEFDDRKHSIWHQTWFLPMLQVTLSLNHRYQAKSHQPSSYQYISYQQTSYQHPLPIIRPIKHATIQMILLIPYSTLPYSSFLAHRHQHTLSIHLCKILIQSHALKMCLVGLRRSMVPSIIPLIVPSIVSW